MMIMLSEMMQFLIIIAKPWNPIGFGSICQNVKISRTEGGSMYSPHFVLTPALVVKAIYVHGFGLNRLEILEESRQAGLT